MVTIDVPDRLPRGRDSAARAAQGRDGRDGESRDGLGAARLQGARARGLVGFRTEFLTETRGTGMLHHLFDGWAPWSGELRTHRNGSMVADRRGVTTTYALMNLQERGTLLVGPGTEVYEGMVIGENARAEEMDVNPTKDRKLTNVRSSTAEVLERLTPPMLLSLEQALEFIAEDECVEVTPSAVRLRKVVLDGAIRGRARVRGRAEGDRSGSAERADVPLSHLPAPEKAEAVGEASARSLRTTSATARVRPLPRWTGSCPRASEPWWTSAPAREH